jgi:hypothetical protein
MLNKVSKIGTENLNDFLISSLEVQVSMMQQHRHLFFLLIRYFRMKLIPLPGQSICMKSP